MLIVNNIYYKSQGGYTSMKKRIVSLLLLLTMLITVVPTNIALAQDDGAQVTQQQAYSEWAFEDLVVGDTYGIYPSSWYYTGMQKPISHAQLRVLIGGIRGKIINTDSVIDYEKVRFDLHNNMTVKEVLEALYALVASYEFHGDIGIKEGGDALEFMAYHGIFTEKEGELSLVDICTVEQACVIATRIVTYIYDALDAASKGFLWEINSGDNTVYLLGSIHVADYDIYPFSSKMLEVFASADALGVEVDTLNPAIDNNDIMMKYAIYTDGTTLRDHVSEESYQLAVQAGAAIGLSEEMVSFYKPWVLYLTFDVMASINPDSTEELVTAAVLGIDYKFLTDAYLTSKPIIELESIDLQYTMLDSFSEELQELLMVSSIHALIATSEVSTASSDDFLSEVLDYWKTGDVESFLSIVSPTSTDSPDEAELTEEEKKVIELYEEYNYKMFTQRDMGMADKIDQMLKGEGSTTYFVVVGSGHYISDYSVLDMLEEMGYEISQIK